MIELYLFPPSPRAFKVLAVANHLELPYEIRLVDLRKGDQKAPDYAALNPNMRMPTLKDGDYVLWESCAIQHYLAARRPEAGLVPQDERARLDVLRWQFWDLAHWDRVCAVFIVEYVAKPLVLGVNTPDLDAIARATASFHSVATVLNDQIRGKNFVTGNAPTLADFSLGAAMNLAERAHIPLEGYDEINRWYAILRALPSWQKTLQQSGLPPAQAA